MGQAAPGAAAAFQEGVPPCTCILFLQFKFFSTGACGSSFQVASSQYQHGETIPVTVRVAPTACACAYSASKTNSAFHTSMAICKEGGGLRCYQLSHD